MTDIGNLDHLTVSLARERGQEGAEVQGLDQVPVKAAMGS